MCILINAYNRLLADVSRLTGVPLVPPDNIDMNWVLIEAPKLDKQLLHYLEFSESHDPDFPEWLLPLWESFLNSKIKAHNLKYLRTLLVFGYKAIHEPTQMQLVEAQKAFTDANSGVYMWNTAFKSEVVHKRTFEEAKRLVSLVISRINWLDIVPHHGPGAVFPRRMAMMKGQSTSYSAITELYPYYPYFNSMVLSGLDDLMCSEYSSSTIECKMIAVPKDSRGPRLISVHPSEAIWIQQGQRQQLEKAITSNPLTMGRINFDDQKVNGMLALSASSDQSYVTIDLKEASDRIGLMLTDYLFGSSCKYINCTRALRVRLLDSRFEELQMFAPMGNCLTFPVESLVFWSLVRAGILCRHGQYCDDVYVFGDDIIVPTKFYDGAIYGLVQAGLIPNENKTFRKGFFRESCGVDAYQGIDVTPYRMKVSTINSYSDCESLCSLAKRLRVAGFEDTASALYAHVSLALRYRLSLTNNPDCQGICEYVQYGFDKLLTYERRVIYDHDLHKYVVPIRRLESPIEELANHAWWHVQESLIMLTRRSSSKEEIPYFSDRGLEYPSPRGERLTRGLAIFC